MSNQSKCRQKKNFCLTIEIITKVFRQLLDILALWQEYYGFLIFLACSSVVRMVRMIKKGTNKDIFVPTSTYEKHALGEGTTNVQTVSMILSQKYT